VTSYRSFVLAWTALALGLAAAACGAPRDPDLERRVWEARAAAAKAADEARSAVPAPAPAPAPPTTKPPEPRQVEVRTYSTAEVQAILAGLPGAGPKIVAELTTDVGTITCRLDAELAPQTVANFVALAQGTMAWRAAPKAEAVATPFYDGLVFYRVVPNFLVEAGDPAHDQVHGPGWRIQPEHGADAFFETPGAMAMLSDAGAMHGSRFFIVVRPDKSLASKYAAFGQCNEVDLVKRIAEGEQVSKDTPKDPVKIQKVKVFRSE